LKEKYKKTVELLLDILPFVMEDERMALKGGTAINLFYQNLPRYSVDIDLCYLPIEDRDSTYRNINSIMKNIKDSLEKNNLKVMESNPFAGNKEVKLLVKGRDEIIVKVEPNFVLRGTLYNCLKKTSCQNVKEIFKRELSIQCLSYADLYGGKMMAALDRKHPRDLFDIKILLSSKGINEEVKNAFIFYLLSHNRPINEIFEPRKIDLSLVYSSEFVDMTVDQVSLADLENAGAELLTKIKSILSENDKKFIISFVENNPHWDLFFDGKIKDYPSIRWKLINQEKMSKKKHKEYVDSVTKIFR
jgi:predicted nucleotidyltransferase component of viral defense system